MLKFPFETPKIPAAAKFDSPPVNFMSTMINNIMQYFGKLQKPTLLFIAFVLTAGLGVIDYAIGPELAFSIFYLLPIMLAAWLVNRRAGVLISMTSAIVWLFADLFSRESYISPLIPYWNAIMRVGFFLIITYILSALKQSTDREAERARTDYLTGVANLRYFSELADIELSRARRFGRPLTLAYLDLDNFKLVNDRLGHAAGDVVLKKVAETIRSSIRGIDLLGRVGGDEFVMLFPETGPDTANAVIERIQKGLLKVIQENRWPITSSIGVLTCVKIPDSIHTLVTAADHLMYSVKAAGKDSVRYEVYPDQIHSS
jgi:diguanylate cyclase (GGDEF)-like protein